ncbi:unnamed protein product [Phyllotreta striolata]|uniref:SAC3/GANP/THP3 conserved domain-containing protein n=1 Tax=Phyllotreta striolata TaxID=444603 RepID=A0A9N9TIM5_PHYSR|nr:unnamed protein product [Phyllotreta striolata]
MDQKDISSDDIVGKCPHMCPIEEAKLRESQRLLHVFETLPGPQKFTRPKVDIKRAVKCFSRSAAGKDLTDPDKLRPPSVLLETLNYLFNDILNKDASWIVKYDFIADRLRSVRQDMIIQNTSRAHQIVILQPIIRFYAVAAYMFCEEDINQFDPYINNKQLQECLKRLLCMYDYYDTLQKITKNDVCLSNDFLEEHRPYFETLYLIFNLGDVDAINRILNISKNWRTSLVVTSVKMSLCYISGNYFKVCKLLKTLPLSLQIMAYLHMPELRRSCFKTMSVAYSSKNLLFSKAILTDLLLYNSEKELEIDCKHYGLKFNENGVNFLKTDFKANVTKVKPRKNDELDKKLKDVNISSLILNGSN